jgi:SAM-dependent methyltransferase
MLAEEVSPSLEWLCCPACRSELVLGPAVATCTACGCSGGRLATNLLSFLPGEETVARAIVSWPAEFIQRLKTWIESGGTSDTPAHDFREQLAHHGLVRSDGSLTPFGADVRYHVSEFRWQTGRKGLDGILELGAIGPRVRVLDVGCGAAQTLRSLEPDRPVELVGVDTNLRALALGCQFARLEGVPIVLAAATAYALPFREGSFDLVLVRVALNYMHQRRALTEMVRTLRPGGFLFCRVERIWHDLSLIAHSPSPSALACRCRDLGYGSIHSLLGWQTMPGSTLRGGRAFATAGRLVRILKSLGCRTLRVMESPNGPKILGHRTQLVVVAQRETATG